MNNTNPTNKYTKNSGELKYSEWLSSSCSTSCTHRVSLVTNLVIRHEIVCNIRLVLYTVKYVCRGHLMDNEKLPYKTGDLLKEVQFI